MKNPLPSAAYDRLVQEEVEALAQILTESGKSVAILIVASSGQLVETFGKIKVKPSDRIGIAQGLSSEALRIAGDWGL